jgi:hypothetical protein
MVKVARRDGRLITRLNHWAISKQTAPAAAEKKDLLLGGTTQVK